ncbi:hypothetical protein [Priestia megaterium]|uniref:hypothetical protein n=1 Tax=Priestia megaterium TaxID=1404 RepID=UPI002B24272D|nr:hypothetical protein [Priestia megaterium]MEB2294457.1 hypothetical protein [Priestia megaterium]
MSNHEKMGKSQGEIDKELRQRGIDNIINNHGKTILDFLQENGVLTEGQFGLYRQVFEKELEYLEVKLTELGLEALEIEENEDEENTEKILKLGYYNNFEIGCHHLYYVYLGHLEKEVSQKKAVRVYKIENAVQILKYNKNAINLDDLKEILEVLKKYAVDKEVKNYLNSVL